jgi:hypothetical protein
MRMERRFHSKRRKERERERENDPFFRTKRRKERERERMTLSLCLSLSTKGGFTLNRSGGVEIYTVKDLSIFEFGLFPNKKTFGITTPLRKKRDSSFLHPFLDTVQKQQQQIERGGADSTHSLSFIDCSFFLVLFLETGEGRSSCFSKRGF